MLETTLTAVFITGLFGGLHCAGMCGGIVSALAYRTPVAPVKLYGRLSHVVSLGVTSSANAAEGERDFVAPQPACHRHSHQLSTQLQYNLGRLSTYTLLGALAGAIGSLGWWLDIALPLQQGAFLFTNILLIVMGLYLGGVKWIGHALESLGRGVWQRLYPHALHQLKAPGGFSAVAAGALWGLVPCGMVYAVLFAALFSGSVLQGAALMLAFGLGTLPALLALGSASVWLKNKSQQPNLRRAAGAVIVLFGVFGLLRLDAAAHLPLIADLCRNVSSQTFAGWLK